MSVLCVVLCVVYVCCCGALRGSCYLSVLRGWCVVLMRVYRGVCCAVCIAPCLL